jgi:sarcosine oxidase subunit alpha
MHSIEHIKRFTTNGMATDQGKLSNMHGLAIAAEMLGKEIPQVGLTTFRAPYTPVTFGTLINHSRGEAVRPDAQDADARSWEEAMARCSRMSAVEARWYYPRAGEDMHQAVNRECKTVREVAGVFDASTLGKIEVVGPTRRVHEPDLHQPVGHAEAGRCRYGIMLREDGFVYDDGVVGRLARIAST